MGNFLRPGERSRATFATIIGLAASALTLTGCGASAVVTGNFDENVSVDKAPANPNPDTNVDGNENAPVVDNGESNEEISVGVQLTTEQMRAIDSGLAARAEVLNDVIGEILSESFTNVSNGTAEEVNLGVLGGESVSNEFSNRLTGALQSMDTDFTGSYIGVCPTVGTANLDDWTGDGCEGKDRQSDFEHGLFQYTIHTQEDPWGTSADNRRSMGPDSDKPLNIIAVVKDGRVKLVHK